MKAVRYVESGRPPEIVDLPKPSPGPGQVLLRVAGAGVCHSDLHVLDHPLFDRSFTLGHENAGHIAALGEGRLWLEPEEVADLLALFRIPMLRPVVVADAAALGAEGLDLAIVYLPQPYDPAVLEPLAEAVRDSGLLTS